MTAPLDAARLQRAIAALEAQRATLGDEVTELALAPLRQLLAQAEAEAPQLRRAQVTVLFADIVDSTALASRLDAEDVLQVFGRMLERAAACVRAHGGRVLRYTGDGLKAGFGTQGTREDDAARAVQAGLDILAAGREHAAWVAQHHGVEGFALRVGAHTGEVALGAGFESDNTLTGDTVNIAARMEQSAPPGGLRIGAETWAHVRGLFDADEQPPLVLKGLDRPQRTWLVRRPRGQARRRGLRGIEGVPTRMVGRDDELAALQAALQGLQGAAAVTVVGDAGIGKTRLGDEFERWLHAAPERARVLRAGTTPQTEGQVFGLLRDLVTRHCGIADDESLAGARARLEAGIAPLFAADEGAEAAEAHAHLLGHLLGIDASDSRHVQGILRDPGQLRHRALHAAREWLRRMAAGDAAPLVLALEDLHWADDESLDFLHALPEACGGVPLLLLAFARPTLLERRPAWGSGARERRLALAPLAEAPAQALASELLRRLPVLPPALAALLTDRAGGNPFFMEELVKVLIDRGALQPGETWHFDAARLDLSRLPTTLTGVLQARLDSLPADERRSLQQASIVGTVFWEPALEAVDARATGHLPALAQRTLVQAQHDADDLQGWAFHHHLLHQATYATVLKQDRRDGHARVAQWMAGLQGLRAGQFLGAAAEHFERAGDPVNAAEFHARAAEQAGARLAHERVLAHVERALTLRGDPQPDQAALRWRLLMARQRTLGLLARRDEQAADLDALAHWADVLDDDLRRTQVAQVRCVRAIRMADWGDAGVAARQFLAFARRAGDDALRLEAQRMVATVHLKEGERATARALATASLDEARRLGAIDAEAGLLNTLALIAEDEDDRLLPLQLEQQALQLYVRLGDRVREAHARSNLGLRWLKLGALVQARQQLEASLAMLRANGDRTFESATCSFLAQSWLMQGDASQARPFAEQALALATAAQARDYQVVALLCLGNTDLQLQRLPEAREAFSRALDTVQRWRLRWLWDARAHLASVALAEGRPEAALAELQPLLHHVADGGTLAASGEPRLIELTCHRVLARLADPRAFEWLERAHRTLMARAAAIADPEVRAGFLRDLPHHRDIVAAWQAWPQHDRAGQAAT